MAQIIIGIISLLVAATGIYFGVAAAQDYWPFELVDVQNCDFSGDDLVRRAFSGEELQGCDFSGANLQGANFSDANLQGADLSVATLHGANFSDANLHGANFSGANLRGATFSGANWREAFCNTTTQQRCTEDELTEAGVSLQEPTPAPTLTSTSPPSKDTLTPTTVVSATTNPTQPIDKPPPTPTTPPPPTLTSVPVFLFLTTRVSPQKAADTDAKVTGAGSHREGTEVEVTATPETRCVEETNDITIRFKYVFSEWEGVDREQGTTAWVTMNRNRTVTANYVFATSCPPVPETPGPPK